MALCENLPRCKRVWSSFGRKEGAILAGMAWNRINKPRGKGEREGKNPLFVAATQLMETKSPVAGGWGLKEEIRARPSFFVTLIPHHPSSSGCCNKVLFEFGPLSRTSAMRGFKVHGCLSCSQGWKWAMAPQDSGDRKKLGWQGKRHS